jgi:hypothetical protein
MHLLHQSIENAHRFSCAEGLPFSCRAQLGTPAKLLKRRFNRRRIRKRKFRFDNNQFIRQAYARD